MAAEPNREATPDAVPAVASPGSIRIELPGRGFVTVENGVDPSLVRAVLGIRRTLLTCSVPYQGPVDAGGRLR